MALESLLVKYDNLQEKQSTIFGKIHCALDKDSGKVVAIKEDTRSKKSNEPEIHQKLGKHPHIVECFGSFSDKHRCYIVMEYCEFGSFKQIVDDHGTLPLRCVQSIFKQIVSALEHIHSLQLLYRNLEACHVLLHEINDNGDMFFKLCDFGATRFMQNEKLGLLQSSVDFNSLGSLLFFMITGSPFINTPEVYEKLASFSELSADLIKKLLNCDSNFGFNDIKSHAFYTIELYGEESFCKEQLSELYESLIEHDGQENEDNFEGSDGENDENTLSFTDKFASRSPRKRLNVTEEESRAHEIEPSFTPNNTQLEVNNSIVQEQLSQEMETEKSNATADPVPIQQPFNNVTVDSAYNSATESPQINEQSSNGHENPSLFACFVAVFRALCGYK